MPLIEHGLEALLNLGAHCVDLVAQSDSVGGTKTLFWDEAPWVGSTPKMGSSPPRWPFLTFMTPKASTSERAEGATLCLFCCMTASKGCPSSGGSLSPGRLLEAPWRLLAQPWQASLIPPWESSLTTGSHRDLVGLWL